MGASRTVPCWYCGRTEQGTRIREHQTPRERGGSGKPSNIVPACVGCNQEKGQATLEEFRRRPWHRRARLVDGLFYGERHHVVPPPKYWKVTTAVCEWGGCEATIDVRTAGFRGALTANGWAHQNGIYCPSHAVLELQRQKDARVADALLYAKRIGLFDPEECC